MEIPITVHEGHLLGHLGWAEDGRFLLLLLQPLSNKLYRLGGVPFVGVGTFQYPHVVYAPAIVNDALLQNLAQLEWRKVYLAHEGAVAGMKTEDTSVSQLVSPVSEPSSTLTLPFHFDPRHLILQHPHMLVFDGNFSRLPDIAWTGDPPMALALLMKWTTGRNCIPEMMISAPAESWMFIHLGLCTN